MNKNPRIAVTMEPGLLNQVKAYAKEQGFSSDSKATAELVRKGIIFIEQKKLPSVQEKEIDNQEWELIKIARELAPDQRTFLLSILRAAVANERQFS